jgi:hypothetical protein
MKAYFRMIGFPLSFSLDYTGIELGPLRRDDRDSSIGIATRYGLDGLGIESRWERDIPHSSRPALGSTKPPVHWVPGLSRG